MKTKKSIQVKAAFLLIVFSLNTMIGFACSVGLDILFTSNHKAEIPASKIHIHADGTKHVHEEEAAKPAVHIHADGKKHIHHEKTEKQSHFTKNNNTATENQSKESEENCCTTTVTNFEQLDKSVPNSSKIIHPVFLIALVSKFYNVDILYTSYINTDIRYFVRSYHPPIPDIRIAIQSFQI